MSHYAIKIDYQPEFTISTEELINQIKDNRIPSTALIRKIDSTEWQALSSYPEFLYQTPPPLPQKNNPENIEKASNKIRVSGLAILSLICGIITCAGGTFYTAIPSIVFGHLSLWKIRKNSNIEGKGLAKAGIIMGYIPFIISFIIILNLAFQSGSKTLEKGIEVSESFKKQKLISDSKTSTKNTNLQQVNGKSLDYTFYVPSNWTVKHETAGFDSVAVSSNSVTASGKEIFGVVIQDSEYNSMNDLVDEVVYNAQSKGAYDFKFEGISEINGVSWTLVKFKFLKNDKLNDCIFYLLTQDGYTIRLCFTSINTPLQDRMELLIQILESFKFKNSIKP